MSENYYQILGIPRDSDEREIKRAYHRIAREFHPDKADSPEQAKEMEQKFASASTAYNLLKDPEQRQEYDRKMFGGTQAPKRDSAGAASAPSAGASSKPAEAGAETDEGRIAKPKVQVAAPVPEKKPAAQQGDHGGEVSAQRQAIAQKAYVKGVKLLREKEYSKAVEFFEAAINNNPNEATYYNRLAGALIEAKKSANRAIEAGQKAIELDKFNLDYYFNLARIYETIGSKSKAISTYEEILRWDADNNSAKQMIRELKRKKGGFAEKLGNASPIIGSILRKFEKD